jgi:hypothetical protein
MYNHIWISLKLLSDEDRKGLNDRHESDKDTNNKPNTLKNILELI